MNKKRNGNIITFYSFKGGTGRSMAVANVAWVLASSGKRVLAIDWDLEAPGLHRYFSPFLIDKDLSATDGVIDFVINFALEAVAPASEDLADDWFKPFANILRYAVALNYDFPNGGSLDFVPAGRQGPSYGSRFNSFDWQNFYDHLGGGHFLEEAKCQMRDEYDYVLIDSRTGVGDTSGICTIQMPDTLVACFTLNNQGLEGALRVAKTAFEKRRESGLRIFPVPMRLDNAENYKLERRSKEARDRFYPFPNHLIDGAWQTYWTDVPVFYVPYYSYEEVLAVFAQSWTAVSMLAAAEKLTKYLTDGSVEQLLPEAMPSQGERDRIMALYTGQPFKMDREAVLDDLAENALARLLPADRVIARRAIERLVRVPGANETLGHTPQRVPLDLFPPVDQRVLQELRNSRLLLLQLEGDSGRVTVQLAQEEFLRYWKTLQNWLQEDREFLLWLAGLIQNLSQWQRARSITNVEGTVQDPDSLLLNNAALSEAQSWLEKRRRDIYPIERRYIEFSLRKNGAPRSAQQTSAEAAPSVRRPNRENVERARDLLRGKRGEPQELLALAKKLKAEMRFSYARRLLLRARNRESVTRDKKLQRTILQQLALCTYKDQDLPPDDGLPERWPRWKKLMISLPLQIRRLLAFSVRFTSANGKSTTNVKIWIDPSHTICAVMNKERSRTRAIRALMRLLCWINWPISQRKKPKRPANLHLSQTNGASVLAKYGAT